MLLVTLLVALVADAAVVPSETPEVFVYTTTFNNKFEKSDQTLIDNLYEDRSVSRLDNRKLRQELKASQQFSTDRIPSQKPPAQVSWQRDAKQEEDGARIVTGPQQDNRAEKTREAWRNAQDQETRLHLGGVNDPDLYADQSVKDGTASASSGQSRKKSTRKPDFSTSVPPDGFMLYFGSKRVRSEPTLEINEATNRQGSQPESSRTVTDPQTIQRTGNSQIFDYTSRNNPRFGDGKITNQDSGKSDSKSEFSANTEGDKTESGNKHGTSPKTGNYQRFNYTEPSGNRRTEENGGTQKDDDKITGSRVGGNGGDDDGKIYFQPDLERRAMTERAKLVTTTPATVDLDNRNAFDVNVTCGPHMAKTPNGACAPTE